MFKSVWKVVWREYLAASILSICYFISFYFMYQLSLNIMSMEAYHSIIKIASLLPIAWLVLIAGCNKYLYKMMYYCVYKLST